MSTPSQNQSAEGMQNPAQKIVPANVKVVERCNFGLSGRLSNEDARLLTSLNETAASQISRFLDITFGTDFRVEFKSIREITVREYLAESPAISYAVPLASGAAIADIGVELVYPLIELLMGGAGEAPDVLRDLSEIEEELMHDLTVQLLKSVETLWSVPGFPFDPGTRIKSSMRFQNLRPAQKVTILRFDVAFGTTNGWIHLSLSKPILESLLSRIKAGQIKEISKVRTFPAPPLRERMLDCEIEVTTELTDLRVAVRDLIRLRPGSVLKLRAPVKAPGTLTVGGRRVFEAMPVRNGQLRAAQLGRRVPISEWKGL